MLARDMAAGETLPICAWVRTTPKGVLLMLTENRFKAEVVERAKAKEAAIAAQYPKDLNDDEVPF